MLTFFIKYRAEKVFWVSKYNAIDNTFMLEIILYL